MNQHYGWFQNTDARTFVKAENAPRSTCGARRHQNCRSRYFFHGTAAVSYDRQKGRGAVTREILGSGRGAFMATWHAAAVNSKRQWQKRRGRTQTGTSTLSKMESESCPLLSSQCFFLEVAFLYIREARKIRRRRRLTESRHLSQLLGSIGN